MWSGWSLAPGYSWFKTHTIPSTCGEWLINFVIYVLKEDQYCIYDELNFYLNIRDLMQNDSEPMFKEAQKSR